MNMYSAVYDFAASAGALEGYLYHKRDAGQLDMAALPAWIDNLRAAHASLPEDVREAVREGCDRTLGRAVRSLEAIVGPGNPLVEGLASLVKGPLPSSPDAFDKRKWFQEPGAGGGR